MAGGSVANERLLRYEDRVCANRWRCVFKGRHLKHRSFLSWLLGSLNDPALLEENPQESALTARGRARKTPKVMRMVSSSGRPQLDHI